MKEENGASGRKKLKKDQWLILFLAGILLLVIAIPTNCGGSTDEEETAEASDLSADRVYDEYEEELEAQLEDVLSKMEGVGAVKVMITFRDSGEAVVEKDVSYTQEETVSGEDNSSNSKTESSEETIYDGDEEPFVSREILPSVSGVLVVAEGGENLTVVADISEAVEALFGLEAHKIKVVKMEQVQEGAD
ncbi:MAG: stage III sporulation protein AG [Clostridiales bacterium]|nr:stage III sporulation protein AG [Clostridiales bacterium]